MAKRGKKWLYCNLKVEIASQRGEYLFEMLPCSNKKRGDLVYYQVCAFTAMLTLKIPLPT
ncbi:hypothetical protein [Helicobacter sp. 11S02629-2]|uniref:hypothetical protein n=1 Tax=Helicobacter sp. 11S02629-2 TaxID=1476195 RepID=UPI000BA50119|nr:hypothetical protein [Helicobacter sp. 11S02629-2]PAF44367.1 hypothetical protein BKH40_05585 [Helicobacter sp. 11S02629-2]